MTSASIATSLQILSLFFDIVLIFRLLQLRLSTGYPLFFTFLCIPLIPQTCLVYWGDASKQFFYAWGIIEPLRNISYILVVWELFSVIFRNYAGLRSLSRWVMGGAAAIAPVGFLLTLAAPGSHLFNRYALGLIRFERGVACGLVIFIIVLLYFISKYPIKLPRNHVVLCMLYSIWFLGDSAILLASSFVPAGYVEAVNGCLAVLEIGSYLGWALLLSKAGEYQETRVRRDITPEHEKILIGELNAMNQVLMRAGRSISGRPEANRTR